VAAAVGRELFTLVADCMRSLLAAASPTVPVVAMTTCDVIIALLLSSGLSDDVVAIDSLKGFPVDNST